MRATPVLIAGTLLLGLVIAGCNGGNGDTTKVNTPTATPQLTLGQILVNTPELPSGCAAQSENSPFRGYYARSFDCGEVRLTNVVGFLGSEDEARIWMSNNWGTRDGILDLVRPSLVARPTDPNSLRVDEVTQLSPKLGADEERLYCVTFTDPSGIQRVTEYWGGYRYKSVVVQYTASALTPGSCENASRVPEMARALATAQLNKLRATVK